MFPCLRTWSENNCKDTNQWLGPLENYCVNNDSQNNNEVRLQNKNTRNNLLDFNIQPIVWEEVTVLEHKGKPTIPLWLKNYKERRDENVTCFNKKTHNKTRSWVSFPLLSEQWPKTYSLKVVMDHLKRTEKNSNPQILDTLNHTGNQWSETKYKSSCQKPQLWWRKSEEFSSPLLYLSSPRPFNTLTLLCPSIIFPYQCLWCFTLTSDESRDGGPLGPPTKAR